jgi:hypothetical protein
MRHTTSWILAAGVSISILIGVAATVMSQHRQQALENLVTQCLSENEQIKGKLSGVFRECDPYALPSGMTDRHAGVQAKIVAANQTQVDASHWIRFSLVLAGVSGVPWLWYFLLRRLAEVRAALDCRSMPEQKPERRPVESALDRYLFDMLIAVEAGAYHSALALALTIPDICGAIEYPTEPAANRRYRNWFDAWCQLIQSTMGAADCWALRCSYLHLAREEFAGDAAAYAALSRIQFTVGKDQGGWLSRAIPAKPGEKPAVQLPVENFCRDMATSADAWRRSRAGDARTCAELHQLLELRPAGQ